MPKFPNWYHGGDTMADQLDKAAAEGKLDETPVEMRPDGTIIESWGAVLDRLSPAECDGEFDDDREWCSIYGYDVPKEHACEIGVCFNPYWDGQKRMTEEQAEEARDYMRRPPPELDFGPVSEDND
jgi:hypothetical protein